MELAAVNLLMLSSHFPCLRAMRLLILVFVCVGVSCRAASTVDVSTSQDLVRAFQNNDVSVINVVDNIVLSKQWSDPVILKRNVTVTGGSLNSFRMLDFNGVVRVIALPPRTILSFTNISLNTTSWPQTGFQPVNFGWFLQHSPDAEVLLDGANLYANVCPFDVQTPNGLKDVAATVQRDKSCPRGTQSLTIQQFCNLERCWKNAWWHTDFCYRVPELDTPRGTLGDHIELYKRTLLMCNVRMFSWPCRRSSINDPICSEDAPVPSGSAPPTSGTAANTPSSATIALAQPSNKKSKDDNSGAIAAGVVVPLVVIALAALLFVFRKKIFRQPPAPQDELPVTQPLAKSTVETGREGLMDNSNISDGGASSGIRTTAVPPESSRSRQTTAAASSISSTFPNSVCDMNVDDRIEFSSLIGRGSFGSVFRGTWHNQTIAVKILQHNAKQLQQIQNEAHLNSCLRHPNVATALQIIHKRVGATKLTVPGSDVQSLTDQSGSLTVDAPLGSDLMETWIIMEMCDQGSLETLNNKGTFNKDGNVFMHPLLLRLRDVAAGMMYIHKKNIIHGDLKAGNVLVGTSDTDPYRCAAKVADFGLSRILLSTQSHLSTRTMGTPSRMPPELLLKGQMSPGGDVYAFSILMYELATGEVPFRMTAIGELIHRVVINHERPVIPPHIPKPYAELMRACWAPDRSKRPTFQHIYQAVDAMLANVDALQEEVDTFNVDAHSSTSGTPSRGPASITSPPSSTAPLMLDGPQIQIAADPGKQGSPGPAARGN